MTKKQKQFLFCPGPVNIAKNVKEAVYNEIGHREIEFSELIKSVNIKLLNLFDLDKNSEFHPVFITGSGTAANESVISSVVNDKNILIISNGEFGERLLNISSLHNPHTFSIKLDWGEKFNLEIIEKFIKKNKIQILMMVHHETSTGMLNPIEKIGKITKRNNVLFIVDAVSSAGAEKIDLKKANIDFLTGTSGKAISSLPGIGFIIGKKDEFEKLKDYQIKMVYLNLYNLYHYSDHYDQTPNTPAVQLFFSLDEALGNILKETVEQRISHIKEMTTLLRNGMKELGLTFLIDEKDMCSVLTTINLPEDIGFEKLKNALREKNIIVYNGKGPLLNKIFQVGNIGAIDKNNVKYFLKSLSKSLKEIRKELELEKSIEKKNLLTLEYASALQI